MDNSAYLERAGDYDLENEGKSRTMLKKAALVGTLIERRGAVRRILEVGCGTGLFTRLLAERFPDAAITATDAFAPMLVHARARLASHPNVTLREYDAEQPVPFDDRFDVVCGVDIIHHLNDPIAALEHWRRAAGPGALLAFFESNPRNPVLFVRTRNRPEEVRFKYNTRSNLTGWASAAGWTRARATYAPIHLPSGPPALWPLLDRIESLVHPLLRPIAGGMLVEASLP
jgi:SAM-dependent methyltransferase